jgi:hypothetical protein
MGAAMTLPDGGVAFPTVEDLNNQSLTTLTLRDWFAGQALVGLVLGMNADARRRYRRRDLDPVGVVAYAIADAMLKERINA